jgi:hypothetical protein
MPSSDVCLILYHDPSIGIDEAAEALSKRVEVERNGDVLHARRSAGTEPVLRVRAVSAVSPGDGRVRWDRDLPDAVAAFRRAFEVTFDELDETLDEINTLIEVQATLAHLTGGAVYRSWNGNLSLPGSDGA